MNRKIYYVVTIGTCSCVFDNFKDASYFMRESAEHITASRYQVARPDIEMKALTDDQLPSYFPHEYKKEDAADETTTCTDADQTEV